MNLKRGCVFGVVVLTLLITSSLEAQAQGVPSRLSELQDRVDRALATLGQLETAVGRIAQLEAALAAEKAAREAADTALQNAISAGGGVNQAALDAAIAAEATARSGADAALEGQIANEAAARAVLAATVAPLATLTPLVPLATYVTVQTGPINNLAGPHVIITGANLHLRNGAPSNDSLSANGWGNLIVGYNEPSGYPSAERGGSHNVVVGGYHRYDFGTGLVAGYDNRLGGMAATVPGGISNSADGPFSSVNGGRGNRASGKFATVSGGESNLASGTSASVAGGVSNSATGDLSSVAGGSGNAAIGLASTVGGGANTPNPYDYTFVP